MNELQIFNSEEFGEIRTITKDDETYCVTAYGRQMLNDVLEMFLH